MNTPIPAATTERDPRWQELFRLTVDQAGEAVLLVDVATGAFIEFNEAAHSNLGYSREEFARLCVSDIEASQSSEAIKQHFEALQLAGKGAFETRHRHKDGSIREVHVRVRQMHLDGRAFFGVVITDITDYKRLESTLKVTADFVSRDIGEGFFDALVQFAADIFSVDYVHIALLDEQPGRVHTIAAWLDGHAIESGYLYDLAGTPCQNVVNLVHKCYPDSVQKLFPEDHDLVALAAKSYVGEPILDGEGHAVGLIVLVARRPLVYSEAVASGLRILASRASAELVRRRAACQHEEAEAAIRKSEARFRAIFDGLNDAVFLHDFETGAILDVNAKAEEMHGYSRDEIRRLGVGELSANVSPYREADALQWLAKARRGEPQVFEWLSRHRDGLLFWVEISMRAADLAGQQTILVNARNISERKQAELALRLSEQRYRLISSFTNDLIFASSRSDEQRFTIDWAAGSAEMIFGHSVTEIEQRGCWRCFVHHDDLPLFDRNITRLAPGQSAKFELRVHHCDGSIRYLRVLSKVLDEFEGDDRLHLFGTCQDITENKLAELALRESQSLLATVIDENPNIILMKDWEGRFLLANRALATLYGTTPEAMVGKDDGAFNPNREQVRFFLQNVQNIMRSGETEVVMETSTDVATGENRYFHSIKKPLTGPDGAPRILVIATDVTDLMQAQRQAEESERRLEYALTATGEGIWDWDMQSGRVLHNAQWCRLLGFDESKLCHPIKDFEALLYSEDVDEVRAALQGCLAGETPYHSQHRMRRGDGRVIWVLDRGEVVERDPQGQALRMVGSIKDITAQHESQQRIEFLAHHDPLTKLPNRLLSRDRCEQAMSRTVRSKGKMAMLFLDLDQFKTINDTLGHQIGDQLLQRLVDRLQARLRASDSISRQGGDEFLIILSELRSANGADAVAQNILADFSQPFEVEGHVLHTSFSIGISVFPDDGEDFDTLLKKADTAMYSAKEAGRNAYRFYTDEMNALAFERLQIQNHLRQALFANEFQLHYQPQVNLDDGRIIGFEALLRWQSAKFGMMPPGSFIPVAEDSGLILPIGKWVLEEACRQARRWQDRYGCNLPVAVNLSALQFRRGDLVADVRAALSGSGLDPGLLELELTESILLQDVGVAQHTIEELRALGVGMSIDDFGTGYSSLSYLKRLHVDRLKIDQSFIRDMISDPEDAAIVRAIIQIAQSLKLTVIAEGVEQAEQADWLLKAECKQAQGYYFGRPLTADAIEMELLPVLVFPPG